MVFFSIIGVVHITANEVRNYPKPNDTLWACYLPQEGFYQLFFEVNGNTKVVEPIY